MTNLLTFEKVRALARKVGFPTTAYRKGEAADDQIIAALSLCEGQTDASRRQTERDKVPYSDFDAVGDQALANDYWGYSYSGLQIRSVRSQKGTGGLRDELRLPVPEFALTSALAIFKARRARGGYGFEDWSTFNADMHKAYLQTVYPPPDGIYIVVGGDSLSKIAQTTKMGTWSDWARVNNIRSPYTIFIGERLSKLWLVHKVRSGDTLSGILDAYGEGITLQRLIDFNKITNPDVLTVDQIILIPKAAL